MSHFLEINNMIFMLRFQKKRLLRPFFPAAAKTGVSEKDFGLRNALEPRARSSAGRSHTIVGYTCE